MNIVPQMNYFKLFATKFLSLSLPHINEFFFGFFSRAFKDLNKKQKGNNERAGERERKEEREILTLFV